MGLQQQEERCTRRIAIHPTWQLEKLELSDRRGMTRSRGNEVCDSCRLSTVGTPKQRASLSDLGQIL